MSSKLQLSKKVAYAVLVFCLYFMTLEILWRRLVWHQIPTSLPALLVYLLLLVNVSLAFYFISPIVKALAGERKQGKN